jgi:hypothetical protein
MVAHFYNPSMQKAEAGGSQVWRKPRLHSETLSQKKKSDSSDISQTLFCFITVLPILGDLHVHIYSSLSIKAYIHIFTEKLSVDLTGIDLDLYIKEGKIDVYLNSINLLIHEHILSLSTYLISLTTVL